MGRLWATGVGDCVGGRRVELGYYNICLFVDIKTQFMQRHYYQTLLTFESRLQHAPPAACLLPPATRMCNMQQCGFLRCGFTASHRRCCRLYPRCVAAAGNFDLSLTTLTTLAFHLMTYCLWNRWMCKFNGKLKDLRLKGERNCARYKRRCIYCYSELS